MARRPRHWLRAAILEIVRSSSVPLRAIEIAARMPEQGAAIHLGAIFRALNELLATDEVRRVECANAYVAGDEPAGIALVCTVCRGYREMPAASLRTDIERLARRPTFHPKRLVIEVIGQCEACGRSPTPPTGSQVRKSC